MSEIWFYAERGKQIGPLTLDGLRQKLAKTPNAKEVLVWGDEFPDWKRAGDVPELKAQTAVPPPLSKLSERTFSAQAIDSTNQESLPLNEINGIAGWLIFPVLGTILAPFYVAYNTFQIGTAIANAPSKITAGLSLFVLSEFIFNMVMLACWIIVLIFALKHKRLYPKLFLLLAAVTLIESCLDVYIATAVFDFPFEPSDSKGIVQSLFTLIIWGPYMYLSRRVKNTFVN